MSVAVPRDISEDASSRLDAGIDAWALCAEFVERIVSDARRAAERDNPGHPVPEIDLEHIWRAGDGAPSDERAIGRIVRAASEAAQGIAPGTVPRTAVQPSGPNPGRAGGELAEEGELAEGARTHRPPAPDELEAPVAPFVPVASPGAVSEPVTGLVKPVAAPPEPEPETAVEVSVTAPVLLAVAPSGSVIVDRPDLGATTRPTEGEELPGPPIAVGETAPSPAAAARAARTRAGWVTVFTWIRNIGAIIILFVAWQLWGTAISQHQAQDQLKSAFDASLKAHHPPAAAAKGALIPASTHFGSPADGSVLAQLQIPKLDLDQYVVAGTSSTDLSKGPGHYVGTALPGQAGNVAIAGHRTTHGAPFNRLGQLTRGDKIILTTTWGEHLTYVVSGTPTAVSPNDVAVLNYFGDNRITLTTCTPEYSSAQRLVVVGALRGHGATPTPPAKHITYHIADPGTASWDWSLLPAVGIALCLLVLLGMSNRRIGVWFGSRAKWVILVPIWAAGLYLLFSLLTTFLPATI